MGGLVNMYGMVAEGIREYTGLSVTALAVIAGLMLVTYKIVCSMFVAAEDYTAVKQMEKVYEQDMTREAVQIGDRVTEEELQAYDGSDPNKPLLMAIKGKIYDVSRGRMFYGPGGPYAMFAGRDATRALALMSFDAQDLTGNTEGLSESELEVLQDWELKFMEKYPEVGRLLVSTTVHEQQQPEDSVSEPPPPPPLQTKKAL